MDENGIILFLTEGSSIKVTLPFLTVLWLTTFIFGTLIGCSKKKQEPTKKLGVSAASGVLASPGDAPNKSPAAGAGTSTSTNAPNAAAGGGAGNGKPSTSQNPAGDGKNAADNKDDKKDDKKPDEKADEKQSEKKEDEKKDDEKKDDDKKDSKKEDDKKKEPSNKDEKKKSEKPNNNNGDKKDGGGGAGAPSGKEKASCKPELSTNRTQPSKSIKVKDDDDTVKHIESLKEDKEKSE